MFEDRRSILDLCGSELYSAVVADTLDSLGYHDQCVAPGLSAIKEGMRIAGFARTGIYMPVFHDDAELNVYEQELRLIDDLKPGEVPILVCNGDVGMAPWGELLSTRAQYLGASGCITDGSIRDVASVAKMRFPVFSAGRYPADTKYRGKMVLADMPARLGGARVKSGDLVIADEDGIVVAPSELVNDVLRGALEKVRKEDTVRDELRAGATLGDVFARHGIL